MSSSVHPFQSAALFKVGNQSSRRHSGSSPVKGSTGGAFPRRTRDATGAPPLSTEAASEESDGLDLRRRVTSSRSLPISSSFSANELSSSANCSQLSLHRSLVLPFCSSSSALSCAISSRNAVTVSDSDSPSSSDELSEAVG